MNLYSAFIALRLIPLDGASYGEAAKYTMNINAYPLSQADNPPKGDYIDMADAHVPKAQRDKAAEEQTKKRRKANKKITKSCDRSIRSLLHDYGIGSTWNDPGQITENKNDYRYSRIIDWEYQIAYQRGIEAMNWAMPAVSMLSMRDKGNFSQSGGYNSVYWISNPPTALAETVTANNQTPYAAVYINTKERLAPATATWKVNGEQVGRGRVERSVPSLFTASETFDVGVDLGSPVALDYFDRAPFRFNGKIEKINIRYTDEKEPVFPHSADDD